MRFCLNKGLLKKKMVRKPDVERWATTKTHPTRKELKKRTEEKKIQRKEEMEQRTLPLETSLFDRLCELGTLKLGFLAVKKNKGSPGIDGVTTKTFEQNLTKELTQLRQELISWSYKPQPVRRVEIPKAAGGTRLLGVPCI